MEAKELRDAIERIQPTKAELRKRAGLPHLNTPHITQGELADRLCVSLRTVNRWANGKTRINCRLEHKIRQWLRGTR